jgi:hypothetical protein
VRDLLAARDEAGGVGVTGSKVDGLAVGEQGGRAIVVLDEGQAGHRAAPEGVTGPQPRHELGRRDRRFRRDSLTIPVGTSHELAKPSVDGRIVANKVL